MWPFKRNAVRAMTESELVQVISKLQTRVMGLEDRLEALDGQHRSLRGRVYALWGKEPPHTDAAPAAGGSPASSGGGELSLTDPRLTKDQLRHRLIRPGKPYPHSE